MTPIGDDNLAAPLQHSGPGELRPTITEKMKSTLRQPAAKLS
jgi:hypothetical protein